MSVHTFHLNTGDTVTLAARNKLGHETNDVRDAISVFHRMFGKETRFTLDTEMQERRRRILEAPLSPVREAEIRAAFPKFWN